MMMLLIPLATFYVSFILIFKSNRDMLGWCGLFSVVSVNVVVASYVLMAWNEDKDEKKESAAVAAAAEGNAGKKGKGQKGL